MRVVGKSNVLIDLTRQRVHLGLDAEMLSGDRGRVGSHDRNTVPICLSTLIAMEDIAEALTALYEEWFATLCVEGTGRLREILADEWVYTNYDGMGRDRAESARDVAAVGDRVDRDDLGRAELTGRRDRRESDRTAADHRDRASRSRPWKMAESRLS